MSHFNFLRELDNKRSPLADFWRLEEHVIPDSPGVYLLVAKPGARFMYPLRRSPIFYIGQGASLRQRLLQHLEFATHVREDRRVTYSRYYPRYEYAAAFGARYCFIRTWRGLTPKALEEIVVARFAGCFGTWPIANGAVSWERLMLSRRKEPNKAPEPTPTAVTSRAIRFSECRIVRKARLAPAVGVAHL